MRGALLLVGLLALSTVPAASAEWGPYGPDGWPVAVDGASTNPYPGTVAVPHLEPLNEKGGVTLFPYWPLLTAEVQRLATEHSDIVKLHSLGKSTLGLDLWMLEIADFTNPEMLPLEEREVVWIDGGTHSNEYSGVYFVTHLAGWLTDGYGVNETATWIVENRHTWLMPMVNPDGSNLFGRLNAHLVNINRNYPVVWDGEGHDEVMNNRGPYPASEVETQINIEWFNKTTPDYYASVHCCGNLWLYPYGEEGIDPVDNGTFARICQEALPSVGERCGPIWSTIYPASGSSVDTAYEYTGAVAWGFEMSGRGAVAIWGQPFTTSQVETQEVESWNAVLHAFRNVERYGGHPVLSTLGVWPAGELSFEVGNDGYGPLDLRAVRVLQGEKTLLARSFDPGVPGARVEPNGTAAFSHSLELAEGPAVVEVEFAKRIQAGPIEMTRLPFEVLRGEDGRLLAVAGGTEAPAALESPDEARAPGIPAPLALAAFAALVVFLRRRA